MNKDELQEKIKKLTPEEYKVTQEAGTEAPFKNEYWDHHDEGAYMCKVCGQELFDSKTKFESGTGWPSFDQAKEGSVLFKTDAGHGMNRTEVVCSHCGAHLGHKFDDGPSDTTGVRFCMNSCSLDFKKK